jgi:hypothetical protein
MAFLGRDRLTGADLGRRARWEADQPNFADRPFESIKSSAARQTTTGPANPNPVVCVYLSARGDDLVADAQRMQEVRSMSTYEELKKDSLAWFNKASDLRGGAAVLWASMKSESCEIATELGLDKGFSMRTALPLVYRMLCGMSLELLFKSVIVARGKKPAKTHVLSNLASDGGIAYTAEQRDLLQILTEAIIWDGKYPTPEDKDDWDNLNRLEYVRLFDKALFGSSGLELLTANEALDWDSYSELWRAATSKLFDVADWIG